MHSGSSGLRNYNPSSSSIEEAPATRWRYTATKAVHPPIIAAGTVYFTADDRHLYAVDAKTGRERWHTYFQAGLGGTPAYADEGLYVCDASDTVYRIQPATGAIEWKFELQTSSTVYGSGYRPPSPVVTDGLVYAPTKSELYAIDVRTGDPRWVRRPGGKGSSLLTHPAVSPSRVVIGQWTWGALSYPSENRGLYSYDAKTGELLWVNSPQTTDDGIQRIEDPPALTPDAVYVTHEQEEVLRIDAATGEIGWSHALGELGYGTPSGLTVTDSTAYCYITRSILALALETGEERWQKSVNVDMSGTRPPADSEQIYTWVGGDVWALDATSGERQWTYPGLLGSITVADGTLYVVRNKTITALEADGLERDRVRQEVLRRMKRWSHSGLDSLSSSGISTHHGDLDGRENANYRLRLQP